MMSNRLLAEQLFPIATINRTYAEGVLSSVPYGSSDPRHDPCRLDSMYLKFGKFLIGERNRHRCFSLSDRSSRAVPPEKLIAEIRCGEGIAVPAKFRGRAKGMGGGDELIGDELIEAQLGWIEDALDSADAAEHAALRGEGKDTVNRRIDWCIYMHSLQTGTRDGWLNFLGLRLDGGADESIRVLAQQCFMVYVASAQQFLRPGEWHTPFVCDDDEELWKFLELAGRSGDLHDSMILNARLQLSAARSAHLSYNDHETGQRMTMDRALLIVQKLRDSRPLHASPFEHQATPDAINVYDSGIDFGDIGEENVRRNMVWEHPEQHGNLYGWRQQRKTIPGEAVASLPAGYMI